MNPPPSFTHSEGSAIGHQLNVIVSTTPLNTNNRVSAYASRAKNLFNQGLGKPIHKDPLISRQTDVHQEGLQDPARVQEHLTTGTRPQGQDPNVTSQTQEEKSNQPVSGKLEDPRQYM